MEQTVIFRDYQEAQSDDFNNIQAYTRQSFDDLVNDAVTTSLRYSGFSTTISGTAEVTAGPGRFYGANTAGEVGAVFSLSTSTVISLVAYLAVSSQRYVTLVCYGADNQTDNQTRDFLTNVTTGQTEPQSVPMIDSRDAVLSIVQGTEAPAPVPPAVPANQVAVANILMSATGVVSVTMLTEQLVTSTEDLNERLGLVEAFDQTVELQVSTLTSDLAALALLIGNEGNLSPMVIQLITDMALVKAVLKLPQNYAEYSGSYFMFADPTLCDTGNTQALGYNCNVDEGIRFPWQNAADFSLSMFNPLDPNGTYNSGTGLLLPAYNEVVKIDTSRGGLPTEPGPNPTPSAITSTVALGQYGYQTFTNTEIDVPYTRIQNGGAFYTCTNGYTSQGAPTGNWINSGSVWDNNGPSNLPNFAEYSVVSGVSFTATDGATTVQDAHATTNYDYLTIQSWTEPYWAATAVNNTISGALAAQTLLIGSDTWLTRIGLWFASIASNTDVIIQLALCTNGQPDLTQVIAKGTIPGSTLTTGMNFLEIPPTFVQNGMRVAVVITTLANHTVGLVATGSYHGGTFFYSLDGSYFLGDFTKDLAVQLWGCEFTSSQTTVQLGSLNLAGGIRDIDLTAKMQIPNACQLVFEVQPAGSSSWIPISEGAPLEPFASAPVLANFRARFVGTPDIMPGLFLSNSLCIISCPGPAFTFVSMPQTLAAATATIVVKIQVEGFNPAAHTCGVKLYAGGPLTVHNPETTPDPVTTSLVAATPNEVDSAAGTYEITATFAMSPSVSSFVIEINGTTNSVANTFLVANMVWYAL